MSPANFAILEKKLATPDQQRAAAASTSAIAPDGASQLGGSCGATGRVPLDR